MGVVSIILGIDVVWRAKIEQGGGTQVANGWRFGRPRLAGVPVG
jgi:hypothetical protein